MENIKINKIIGENSGGGYKNILLTFNENYLYQTGNLILSLNKYNDGLFFYLFCDKVTKQIEEYLFSVCKNIKIYEFSLGVDIKSSRWPSLTIMRLFAPFIIEDDISDILYMDSDIICKGNLDKLFNSVKSNYLIAMAPEVSGQVLYDDRSKICLDKYPVDLYCNAGVCMINVARYKKEYTFDEIYSNFVKNLDQLDCYDQDFLNYYFHDEIHYIRQEYDFILHEYKGTSIYKQALANAKLIHFIDKPWNWRSKDYVKRFYLKYSFDKTVMKKVIVERLRGVFLKPLRKLKHFISREKLLL